MKVFATMALVLATFILPAQTVTEMKLPWNSGQKVVLNLKFAKNISIEAWDKKEISLKAEVTINNGQLDHAHVMDSTITHDEIGIETDFDEELIPKNVWCDCDGTSHYNVNRKNKGQWLCSEIFYTVYVPRNADLKLETISGDIKIVNMKGAIDAESISGTVEVLIPAGQQVDVHLKTVRGRASSYPDVTTLHQGLRPMLSRELTGKFNGGGKEVRLESVTGDVSLRSSN
jgi:hypothetical protein